MLLSGERVGAREYITREDLGRLGPRKPLARDRTQDPAAGDFLQSISNLTGRDRGAGGPRGLEHTLDQNRRHEHAGHIVHGDEGKGAGKGVDSDPHRIPARLPARRNRDARPAWILAGGGDALRVVKQRGRNDHRDLPDGFDLEKRIEDALERGAPAHLEEKLRPERAHAATLPRTG